MNQFKKEPFGKSGSKGANRSQQRTLPPSQKSRPQNKNQNQNQNYQGQNPNRNQNQRRNERPLNSRPEDFFTKLNRLFDEYLLKRKKYYESFNKLNPSQKLRGENELYELLRNYRKQEQLVKERFFNKFGDKAELPFDLIYSSNHYPESEEKIVPPPQNEIVDPHMTQAQITKTKGHFKNDKEESLGTIDDYTQLRLEKK